MTHEFNEVQYMYKAELNRVIDGDTIDVSIDVGFKTHLFKRLRFLEIDTEELRSSDTERRVLANESKDRVIELLSQEDADIHVETVMDSTGKYGRLLAYVWFNDLGVRKCLNHLLVEEGHEKA